MGQSVFPVPSTLTTKGDLLAFDTAPNRLPVGADGTTLVANSASATGVAWAGPTFAAGKNKIINGDMSISQRGSSIAAGGYTLDRWVITGTGTATQTAFTAGTAPVAGYEAPYYLNWTITSNQQNAELIQRVEDVRTFAGQTVTLSFWARSTVGAQALNVNIYQSYGSGGSSLTATSVNGAITPNGTWTRYTVTGAIPSIAGKTIGAGSYLWVRVAQLTATTTNTSLDIWGVQLEAGSVATAFQTATGTFQGELAACQRYYYRVTAVTAYSNYGLGQCQGTTTCDALIPFPVTMRIAPSTVEQTGTASNYGVSNSTGSVTACSAVPSLTNYFTSNQVANVIFTVTAGLVAGNVGFVASNNNFSSYLGFSAEL